MTIGVGTRMTCVHFVVSLLHAYYWFAQDTVGYY